MSDTTRDTPVTPCPRCTDGDLWAVPGEPLPAACDACQAATMTDTTNGGPTA